MFDIFKKNNEKIYAPVSGKLIDMSDVNDVAFAKKALGDGVAIIPNENIIKAPCDGILNMIFRTKHAFGIKASNGMELLIHIGIDTVELNGNGFKCFKNVNQKVKKGDPIIEFSPILLKDFDKTVIIAVSNHDEFEKINIGNNIDTNDTIMIKK